MRLHPGEPEAVGWRVVDVPAAVRQLCEASPEVTGRPRVIAIDGRGGAGKTTLAERLRAAVPDSAVLHTDDIAWNHACFDWGAMLAEHILRPLHRGAAVDFRPPAWIAHDRPGSISIPAGLAVLWVEGTGIIRTELAPWLDASVWMQGDLDEQDRRLLARDGDSAEHLEHLARWMLEELPFLLREQPWARATMIVAGPAHLDHDPEAELVVAPPTSPGPGG
ncbi:uridine kinase [Plantactinospora siamensis]|uniref:Uridine kinase n=1 Tax=Plantactinospora siamensis TaxID=555372 RepID=A0ABV6P445_9ACTN